MSWVFEKTMFNYKITCVIIVLDGAMVCFLKGEQNGKKRKRYKKDIKRGSF